MKQNAKQIMEQILAGKDISLAISEGCNKPEGKKTPAKKVVKKAPAKKVTAKMESKAVCTSKKKGKKLFEECEKVDSIICPVCGGENVETRYNADTDESCFVCGDCGNAYVLADATAFDLEAPITAENTDSIATVNAEGEVEVKVAEEAPEAVVDDEVAQVEGMESLEGEFVEETSEEAAEVEEAEEVEAEIEEEAAEVEEAEEVEAEIEEEAAEVEEAEEVEEPTVNPDNWDEEGNFIGDPAEYDGEVVDYPYPTPILPEDAEYSEGYEDEDYEAENEEEDEEEGDLGAAIVAEQRSLSALRAANKKAKVRR